MNLNKLSTDTAIAQFGLEMPEGEPNFSKRESDYDEDDDEGYYEGESGWVKRQFRKACGGSRPKDGRVICQAKHPFNKGKRNDCIDDHRKRQQDYDACVEKVRQQNLDGEKSGTPPESTEEDIQTTPTPRSTGSPTGAGKTMDTPSSEQPKSNKMMYIIIAVVVVLLIVGFIVWKRMKK